MKVEQRTKKKGRAGYTNEDIEKKNLNKKMSQTRRQTSRFQELLDTSTLVLKRKIQIQFSRSTQDVGCYEYLLFIYTKKYFELKKT